MKWAASLGAEYDMVRKEALHIGSAVHEMIEVWLRDKRTIFPPALHETHKVEQANKAFNNFVAWYNDKISEGYNIVIKDLERPILCPWYGGTADCLMTLTTPDGRSSNFIVDFKTSKSISANYLLQTYAYLWAYNNFDMQAIEYPINGIGIIRVDKVLDKYEEMFTTNPTYLQELDQCLGSMVNWFYHYIQADSVTKRVPYNRRSTNG